MTTTELSTREQVRQAMILFQEAHEVHEERAAAFAEIKRLVGSNEKARAQQEAATPPDIYAQLVADYATSERDKAEAAAHLERCEKNLNSLRDILNSETAEVARTTADALGMAATIADTTAQRYAVLTGTKTTYAEIRARYPAKPSNGAAEIPEEDLPF